MTNAMMIELIGYVGSLLVLVSMLMSSVVKLRIINMIGSAIFAVYALIIHSYPTALMNSCLVVINIYNLVKLTRKDQSYALVDGEAGDSLLHYILDYYGEDIGKYFPGFKNKELSSDKAYIVCCNANPAGVLLGRETKEGVLEVALDYSVPAYRDCSVGEYLYSKLPGKGIRTLVFSEERSKEHVSYLNKMGFVKENGAYVKRLDQ